MSRRDLHYFTPESDALAEAFPAEIHGRVTRVVGAIAESQGLAVPVGAQCSILDRHGRHLPAEVVGFRDRHTIVVPYGDTRGIAAGDRIRFVGETARVRVGGHLIGRVLDSRGAPMDGAAPAVSSAVDIAVGSVRRMPVHGQPVNPLARRRIDRCLPTGLRVIDGLFTVGQGQRMGIFAGSGVGKSVLLSMVARNAASDVNVIALIGERGREVREFIERDLGPEGLARSVVVVATSDEPALRRLQAAQVATAIAEGFREEGLEVLLLLDSITRVAMAQREIGLSAGEPPATRGYTPSVFSLLPRLLERAGPGEQASITAFYTVLIEGDDVNDPIGDAVRGVLDGHLWLSRDLAGKSFFPAVDPLLSISRSMTDVASAAHLEAARRVIAMVARYREAEDIIQLGAYVAGADAHLDEAVRAMPSVERFLRQNLREVSAFPEVLEGLEQCVRAGGKPGARSKPGPGSAAAAAARGPRGGGAAAAPRVADPTAVGAQRA